MDATDMTPLLEQLEDDIDEVEEVLEPLLGQALSVTAQKMPVMDKAKLHVLITYTIESLLFSYLRLNGVNAKEHPVRTELTRLKQYHDKIKALETPPEPRTMTLDKAAAGRFIKHGLAGNDKIDLARAEREAKEKAMAQLRAWQAARKKQPVAASTVPQKRPMEEEDDEAAPSDSGNGDGLDPADIAQNVEDMIREEANAGSQDSDRSPTKTPVTEDVQSRLLETPEEKERIIAAKRQRKRSRKENKKAKKQQILAARAAARAPAPNEAQGSSG